MGFGVILAPVSDAEVGRSALETAAMVGRTFGAHVDVLHVRTDPRQIIPYVGEGLSAIGGDVIGARAVDLRAAYREPQPRSDAAGDQPAPDHA